MESFNRDSEGNRKENISRGVGTFILEIIKVFILAFFVIVPVRTFLFQPFFVQGASMEPNFEDSQYLIINEFGYKETKVDVGKSNVFSLEPFKELKRGEAVVFRYPKNREQFFIKRIIGLPGEKVEIRNGRTTVFNPENPNGTDLSEKYLPAGIKTAGDLVLTLKEDEYFVMGDNRGFSSDSRSWGPVKKSDIIGRVLLRAWPLNKLEIF